MSEQDELLLTEDERTPYFQGLEEEAIWDIDGLLEAQLAKVKPIIERQERGRILKEIESKLIYIALEIPDGTPSLHLQSNSHKAAKVWQALSER